VKKWLLFLIAAIMSSSTFAQNLIENSSFEDGISPWKPAGWKLGGGKKWLFPVADSTTSQGAGGSTSMRLDWTNQHICYILYQKEIKLPTAKELELSFWMKAAGYTTFNQVEIAVVFPEIKDKKKNTISLRNPWNRRPEEWTQYTKIIKVPGNVTKARLWIKVHGYKNLKGTNWLDNLYFGPVKKAAAEKPVEKKIVLKRGISTQKHGGVYYPGEKIIYSFEYTDNKLPGKKAEFAWEIFDFDGKKILTGKQVVTLPPQKDGAFQIDLSALNKYPGWFFIKGELSSKGKKLSDVKTSCIVVQKQIGKRDPFFSAKGAGPIEKQIRMGNGSCVITLQRRFIQTGPDSYRMPNEEKMLEEAVRYGFEPFFLFHISQHSTPKNPQQPKFLRQKVNEKLAKGINPYDAEYYQTWRNFFAMLAEKYKDKVQDWYLMDEIYNIYHQSKYELEHYIQVQKIMYEEVKKRKPSNIIGGCGTFIDMNPELGKYLWKTLRNHTDGLACSLYLGKGTVAKGLTLDGPETGKLLNRFKITRDVIGKDTFISGTESGYCFLDFPELDSEKVKEVAKIKARSLVILKAMGVRKWVYFLFENDPSCESARRGYGRTDWGMWNRKWGSPKPHAAAWAVSARVLAFATNPVDASPCPDIYCYVFRKGDKTLAAFWAYSKEDVDAEINMPSDWTGMDFLGRPFSGKKGSNNLKLNDRVLYLEFNAPQEAVAKAFRTGKYVLPEAYVSINRIDGGKVGVMVKNKTAGDLKAEVSLNGSPVQKIIVKRGTIGQAAFAKAPGSGKLSAVVTVNGVKYHAEKEDEWYPVKKLAVPPSLQGNRLIGFEKAAPLVMDSMKHIKPAEIETHGIWTGKDDLSAKIWTGYDDRNFYLGAEVTDDVQVSRYAGQLSWNQDAMQFGFDMGNNDYDLVLSPGGYGNDDREFVLSATPKGPQLFCFTGPSDIRRKLIGKPQVVRSGNKTIYFVALPWSLLGKKPVKGNVFGFNVVIFDFDRKDATISCQLEFSPGITYGKTPALFKRFILE